jgi:hypothetical protein
MVDVRDLVAFYLRLPEEKGGGTYNAAGLREALTMEGFLDQGDQSARLQVKTGVDR